MKFNDRFSVMGGTHCTHCHALVHRHDARFEPRTDEGVESWVVEANGEWVTTHYGVGGWITDLWLAPSGAVHLVGNTGIRQLRPNARGAAPVEVNLEGVLTGVWGLSDDFVLTWGSKQREGVQTNVLYRYDGSSWSEIPAPPIDERGRRTINVIRGTAPDCLLAAGNFGLLSHWDGREWRDAQVPLDAHFGGLHVESPEEMYAVATGLLLEGSEHGWTQALTSEVPLDDVAKFAGRVWVGSSEGGLFAAAGGRLESVKAKALARRLEVGAGGEYLLMATDTMCASTIDGEDFRAWFLESAVHVIEGRNADGSPVT